MSVPYDAIVVGAGFSGAVMAERLASQQNKKVLVIEQRPHIAGNCFDYVNEHGVLVHKYGPHLFHTNNQQVWDYLSQFTDWHPYEHKVQCSVDGQLVPLPFNLNTLHQLYPTSLAGQIEQSLIAEYGLGNKVPILELRKQDNTQLKQLADFIYQKFFVNYTCKQWGCSPEDISPEVTARVPVVISRDDRYFHDKYQAIPSRGYSQLIQNILTHKNISLMLNQPMQDLIELDVESGSVRFMGQAFSGQLIFTGMLDELFDYRFGELPYRSLQFEFKTLDKEYFQPTTTVNYPNMYAYTRITEFKHILPCDSAKTTIVKEYPQDYDREDDNRNIPYYPVFTAENEANHDKYRELCGRFETLTTLGRLADFRYYNMDDAVGRALTLSQSECWRN